MKLTLKCLIDFRSWLGENYEIRMHEFTDLPEFVQNAYMYEFFNHNNNKLDNSVLKYLNHNYNKKFA